jgi:hypothetical protein
MQPRRDPVQEQQLVRDLWQQVEARIDSSGALRAFLTQNEVQSRQSYILCSQLLRAARSATE